MVEVNFVWLPLLSKVSSADLVRFTNVTADLKTLRSAVAKDIGTVTYNVQFPPSATHSLVNFLPEPNTPVLAPSSKQPTICRISHATHVVPRIWYVRNHRSSEGKETRMMFHSRELPVSGSTSSHDREER